MSQEIPIENSIAMTKELKALNYQQPCLAIIYMENIDFPCPLLLKQSRLPLNRVLLSLLLKFPLL